LTQVRQVAQTVLALLVVQVHQAALPVVHLAQVAQVLTLVAHLALTLVAHLALIAQVLTLARLVPIVRPVVVLRG